MFSGDGYLPVLTISRRQRLSRSNWIHKRWVRRPGWARAGRGGPLRAGRENFSGLVRLDWPEFPEGHRLGEKEGINAGSAENPPAFWAGGCLSM